MKRIKFFIILFSILLLNASCSVLSNDIRKEASRVSLATLAKDSDKYVGKTVILGGYINETKIKDDMTAIEVFQASLNAYDEPRSKSKSGGRFVIWAQGSLDPEVYSAGRKITVAGKLIRCKSNGMPKCEIESLETHLWSEHDYGHGPPSDNPDDRYYQYAPPADSWKRPFPYYYY